MDKGKLKMVESAKKRMCLTGLVYEIYSYFEEEWGFDLKIVYIEEKKDSYEILIKYRTNPNQKVEKEYYDYFNKDYNDVMRIENKYDIRIYNGIIAKLIAERLKKEARVEYL
jgi:hypothetical protein